MEREKLVNLAARILLAQIFVISGINKIFNWSGTAKYMASKGLPLIPLLLALAIAFELIGAGLLIANYKPHIGAILLIVFLVIVTPIFHNFWAVPPKQQKLQMIMFLKNLSILGGLLLFAIPKKEKS